jgi:hypothetical protein
VKEAAEKNPKRPNQNIQAAEKTSTRRSSQNIPYRFCFFINIQLSSEIGIECWAMTLPFAVTHGKHDLVKTEVILQRQFPAYAVKFCGFYEFPVLSLLFVFWTILI